MTMDPYTVLWLGWLGTFAVVEGRALFNARQGDTLSEKVWSWFAIRETDGKPSKGGQAKRACLLMFLAWLVAHFLTGGRF